MAHLYLVCGTQAWYQDKEIRSFPTPQKTYRNLNDLFGSKDKLCQPRYLFLTLTVSLDPLTVSSDLLEVSIIPITIATLPPTALQFPLNMDCHH